MALARCFVTRHEDDWLVTLDGRLVTRHESRASADAIAMAAHMGGMDRDTDVVIEPIAGELPELVWSSGEDPLPDGAYTDDGVPSHVRHVQRAGNF